MSLWEYKHITSGPHGFATPALLESYLNQLGKDEWEIISYQTLTTNSLAFNGIARRTTLRDWTLESAAAAAAKIEADKLRAEFAAKFQAAGTPAETAEKPSSLVGETAAPEDGFRKLRDTERDGDPDAAEEGDDWDNWDNLDDDLPTLFEAIKPHLRKSQRGPGQSVGITFLAKRWEQSEGDIIGALKECGFSIPETEDTPAEHLEFEGDLYWLNLNNRHELFLNTREKPRPVFRSVPARKLDPADPAHALLAEEAAAEQAEKAKREQERLNREAEHAARRAEQEARRAEAQAAREAQQAAQAAARAAQQQAAAEARAHASAQAQGSSVTGATTATPDGSGEATAVVAGAASADSAQTENVGISPAGLPDGPLPQSEDLLSAIRPQMRRNRRGHGYSGSLVYLARAFKHSEADLVTALVALGMTVPAAFTDKPVPTTIGEYVYWLNKDNRGGIWINGDEVRTPKSANNAGAQTEAGGDPAVSAPSAETAAPAGAATAEMFPLEAVQSVHPIEASEPASTPAPELTPAPAAFAAVTPEQTPEERPYTPGNSPLTAVRLLMKPNKRGSGFSGEVGQLARTLEQDLQVFLSVISGLGLALPETEEHKPTFVEHGDEIFWLNKNSKDGSVWINAKTSKAAAKKSAATATTPAAVPATPKPRAKKPAK